MLDSFSSFINFSNNELVSLCLTKKISKIFLLIIHSWV